jgi:hypothetical protein
MILRCPQQKAFRPAHTQSADDMQNLYANRRFHTCPLFKPLDRLRLYCLSNAAPFRSGSGKRCAMNIFHNIDDKSDFSNTKMSQKVKSD